MKGWVGYRSGLNITQLEGASPLKRRVEKGRGWQSGSRSAPGMRHERGRILQMAHQVWWQDASMMSRQDVSLSVLEIGGCWFGRFGYSCYIRPLLLHCFRVVWGMVVFMVARGGSQGNIRFVYKTFQSNLSG